MIVGHFLTEHRAVAHWFGADGLQGKVKCQAIDGNRERQDKDDQDNKDDSGSLPCKHSITSTRF